MQFLSRQVVGSSDIRSYSKDEMIWPKAVVDTMNILSGKSK